MQAKWSERISRRIVAALCSTFTSVAHATEELIDNAVDAMGDQDCIVDIRLDKDNDLIVVESDGGKGMGVDEIADWLNWGQSDKEESLIGHWGQGGKAAAGYLGDSVKMWVKLAGSTEIWYLEDHGWRTRSDLRDWDDPVPIDPLSAPDSVACAEKDRGHVRIEISQCVKGRQWRIDSLRRELSATYDQLLRDGKLRVFVNGAEVVATDVPLDATIGKIPIEVVLPDGVVAKGWAARLERQRLHNDVVPSGFRLICKGRVIAENVWFGYNWHGKGSLNNLYGELTITGLTPNLDKTGFVEQDDEVYAELGCRVLEEIAPLVAKLRNMGSQHRVSVREKRTAEQVHAELKQVVDSIAQSGTIDSGESIAVLVERKRRKKKADAGIDMEVKDDSKKDEGKRERKRRANDPIGSLAKMLRGREGKSFPEIRVESWSADQRSALIDEAGRKVILLNKSFPLFLEHRGSKGYVCESALMEWLLDQGDIKDAAAFSARLTFLIGRWAELPAPTISA